MGPNERRDDGQHGWEPQPLHLPLPVPEPEGRDTDSGHEDDDVAGTHVIVIDIH